jgi:O-antigen/teichoic acid export membrane protein
MMTLTRGIGKQSGANEQNDFICGDTATMHAAPVAPARQHESGVHERHLATGTIAQQITLVVSTLTMLAVITILARTLSLSEFGLYGLLVTIPTYLLFAQGSVETAAIKAIAAARGQHERDRAITAALGVYACFGLLAALFIVFGGTALLGVFDIGRGLQEEARQGLLALGIVNVVAWPVKTAQDALRGSGQFVASAVTEAVAYVTFGVFMALALVLSAPLWVVVGLGGAIPLLIGLWSLVALLAVRLPLRLRYSTVSLSYTRSFLEVSFYLLLTGLADLVIYSLDRMILGAYRSVATVGLYEGPVRAHNLLRQLQAALVLTVMPAAAGYVAVGDHRRLQELLLRGTRYIALAMMPLTVTFMVLAGPILEVWLGPRFSTAATAMTILVSYWLFAGGSSVGLTMMIAAGRVRTIAVYAGVTAALNLSISLALAPSLGLVGVVIGTSLPYFLLLPVFARLACRTFAVSMGDYLREGFSIAFAAGAMLATFELLASVALPIDRGEVLLATILVGIAGYVSVVYRIGLRSSERLLVRTVLTEARGRLRSLTVFARAV